MGSPVADLWAWWQQPGFIFNEIPSGDVSNACRGVLLSHDYTSGEGLVKDLRVSNNLAVFFRTLFENRDFWGHENFWKVVVKDSLPMEVTLARHIDETFRSGRRNWWLRYPQGVANSVLEVLVDRRLSFHSTKPRHHQFTAYDNMEWHRRRNAWHVAKAEGYLHDLSDESVIPSAAKKAFVLPYIPRQEDASLRVNDRPKSPDTMVKREPNIGYSARGHEMGNFHHQVEPPPPALPAVKQEPEDWVQLPRQSTSEAEGRDQGEGAANNHANDSVLPTNGPAANDGMPQEAPDRLDPDATLVNQSPEPGKAGGSPIRNTADHEEIAGPSHPIERKRRPLAGEDEPVPKRPRLENVQVGVRANTAKEEEGRSDVDGGEQQGAAAVARSESAGDESSDSSSDEDDDEDSIVSANNGTPPTASSSPVGDIPAAIDSWPRYDERLLRLDLEVSKIPGLEARAKLGEDRHKELMEQQKDQSQQFERVCQIAKTPEPLIESVNQRVAKLESRLQNSETNWKTKFQASAATRVVDRESSAKRLKSLNDRIDRWKTRANKRHETFKSKLEKLSSGITAERLRELEESFKDRFNDWTEYADAQQKKDLSVEAKIEGFEARLAALERQASDKSNGKRDSADKIKDLRARVKRNEAETQRLKELLTSSTLFEQARRSFAGSS